MTTTLTDQLAEGLKQLDITLAHPQKLLAYIDLISKWNRAYNLTSVRKPEAMLVRHIFDSLAIAPFVVGEHIIDVGSGAGLPGIPLALVLPHKQFTLVDANSKKTRFLSQVKFELNLANVQVIHARIEELRPNKPCDTVVSRAFASLDKMVEQTKHLLPEHGNILAMKGFFPVAELAELSVEAEVHTLSVPGLAEQRHLVVCQPNRATSSKRHDMSTTCGTE